MFLPPEILEMILECCTLDTLLYIEKCGILVSENVWRNIGRKDWNTIVSKEDLLNPRKYLESLCPDICVFPYDVTDDYAIIENIVYQRGKFSINGLPTKEDLMYQVACIVLKFKKPFYRYHVSTLSGIQRYSLYRVF